MKHVTLKDLLEGEPQYKSNKIEKLKSICTNVYYTVRNFFKYKIKGYITKRFDLREVWNLDVHLTSYAIKILSKNPSIEVDSMNNTFSKYCSDEYEDVNYTCGTEYQDEFKKALDELAGLVNKMGEEVTPYEVTIRTHILRRVSYLKEIAQGYAEFNTERLKEAGLLYLEGVNTEDTWNNILDKLISSLSTLTKAGRDNSAHILSKILMDLWD
mgnify:CR=1 FL=1